MTRVLVVDDEYSIRATVAEFLSAEGYDVSSAADADAAIQLVNEGQQFDLVLTDIILPRLSGVELIQWLAREMPDAQTILMTGEPTANTAADALRAGARDYLVKPVTKNAILRAAGSAVQIGQIEKDRRRLSAANQRYQQDLEILVEQRTEQLQASNTELQAALRELRDAHQHVIRQERLNALGHMASGIAHDFNNVLMPVLGLSGFLISHQDLLDDRAATLRALKTIQSAATDAREIVRRLREVYKPSDSLEVEAVSLAELVEQCVTLTEPAWHPQAEARGHCITVATDIPPLPPLMLNASQMRETLTNLILNAIHAMPEGGDIQIAAHENGGGVCLTLSDTGSGMPEETVKRCCEPFFTTKGEHGTGLGLAMCHGIVQRHGGSLDIESTEGVGTVVSLSLPLESPQQNRPTTNAPQERSARTCRVLVVDDQDISREIVAMYLSSQGHTPVCASGGPEALEQLAADEFDLIIADRAMPEMAGDEVAVKANELAPDVPFVLLTGFGDLMNSKNEQPEHVDVVASKPITSEELADVLDAAIGARAGREDKRPKSTA